jgi:hypothetical protein
VSAAGRHGVEAPLTFGQLSVLRALQQLPPDRWPETYLSGVVELPAGTNLPDITSAIDTVAGRHDSLRTHFVDGPREADIVLVTAPAGHAVPEIVELPDATAEQATAAAHERTATRFDWADEFAWKPVVITQDDRPTHLVVVVDHIVADGWGLGRILGELRAILRGDDTAGARWLAEVPPQPRDLAHLQRSARWRPRREAAEGYWDTLLAVLPPEVFPWPPDEGKPGRIEGILRSAAAPVMLRRAADRWGVLPQSVLLALTAVAAATTYRQDDVALTLQASNRYDRQWRHIVSSMNQATPLSAAVGQATGPFERFAQRVHGGGLKSYRHGSYHRDQIIEKVRRARGVDLRFDAFFNFMARRATGADAPVPAHLPPATVTITRPRRQVGPRFDVKVRDLPDMPVLLRVDPRLLSQEQVNRVLYWFDDELRRLADEPGTPISDVRRRCEQACRA